MKLRKIICIVLSVILLITVLSSCGNNEKTNDTENTKESTSENTKINAGIESEAVNDTIEEKTMGGGDIYCHIHCTSYHAIPGSLIDRVGQDKVNEWEKKQNQSGPDENNCYANFTLEAFAKDFNIPSKWFEEVYYQGGEYYTHDWDIEAISAGDWSAFEKYCREHVSDHSVMMERRASELTFKWALLDHIEKNEDSDIHKLWSDWTENGQRYNVAKWSIPEFVYKTGMEKSELENILNGLKAPDRDGYIREMFDYDLDMIWEEKDVLLEKTDDLYPIQIDELLRK